MPLSSSKGHGADASGQVRAREAAEQPILGGSARPPAKAETAQRIERNSHTHRVEVRIVARIQLSLQSEVSAGPSKRRRFTYSFRVLTRDWVAKEGNPLHTAAPPVTS